GNAHISYYDVTNGDLKYAADASGSWVATTVDSDGDVGLYTSTALDTSGNAYISYFDNTKGDLKYAVNAAQSAECDLASITASPSKLTIKNKESGIVTVTVEGKDGCLAEGVAVKAKLDKASGKKISVSPEEETTDADGNATFTFTGNKKGNAKASFTAGGLTKKITVKVK
ncbi:MAG TPA: Ig-like domain-containing protein, partial [Candidatus Wunengus sp. YC64]|uniref:Ig-like domain-containing protein n=1 Tax=Candidatus Wunengus sp. YC64 TaxID=3367700 RepID=UPI0040298671